MKTAIQILLNSLVSGLLLSLVAIGFTYIFRVTRVFHLAHGGVYVSGGFAFWWMMQKTSNWFLAIAFALIVVIILIWLIEKTIYLPLSKKQSNQSMSFIASMGVYVIIVNALALLFGSDYITIENTVSGSYVLGYINITKIQIIQTVVGIITIVLLFAYLKLTKSTLILQAISDSDTISKVLGINIEKERAKVFITGSVLAGVAAILQTIDVGIDSQAGMSNTLSAAVVGILLSRLNVYLTIVFSILLTLLQNLVELFLDAQWKDGIIFFILLLVILLRTEGIISYNLRKDRT